MRMCSFQLFNPLYSYYKTLIAWMPLNSTYNTSHEIISKYLVLPLIDIFYNLLIKGLNV